MSSTVLSEQSDKVNLGVSNICWTPLHCQINSITIYWYYFDDVQNPRTSHINLTQMNTRIIDHHKNWNILFLKETMKIKEKKPISNTGLKTFKELQLFWTSCVIYLSINSCRYQFLYIQIVTLIFILCWWLLWNCL